MFMKMHHFPFSLMLLVCFVGSQYSAGSEIYVQCNGAEKNGFEKQMTWDSNCTRVCQYNCSSSLETLKNCSTSVTSASCSLQTTCSNTTGCTCNPHATVSGTDEQAIVKRLDCYNSSIRLELDKCVLNYYGVKLGDLFIGTPSNMTKAQLRAATPNLTCLGTTTYDTGPSYVFDYTFGEKDECNGKVEQTPTFLTFKSGVHALSGSNNGIVDRTSVFFLQFQCTYWRNYTLSAKGFLKPVCGANETFLNGSCANSAYFAVQLPIISRVFDVRLNDPTSALYNEYRIEAKTIITALFNGINMPPLQIAIFDFRSGSIIVDAAVRLRTNPLTPPMTVQDSLDRYITALTNNELPNTDPNVALLVQYTFGTIMVGKTNNNESNLLTQNPCFIGTHTCHSKASCKPTTIKEFICVCITGYVDALPANPGTICLSPCSTQSQNYCLHNGICVVGPITGSPRCLCQAGYSGDICQILNADEPAQRLLQILPWVAAVVLLLFLIVALTLYIRRRQYMKQSFSPSAFIADGRGSSSDAVVGLMRHGEPREFLE